MECFNVPEHQLWRGDFGTGDEWANVKQRSPVAKAYDVGVPKQCHLCGKSFKQSDSLKLHLQTQHQTKPLGLRDAYSNAPTPRGTMHHLDDTRGSLHPRGFSDTRGSLHPRAVAPKQARKPYELDPPAERSCCMYCDKSFAQPDTLSVHITNFHDKWDPVKSVPWSPRHSGAGTSPRAMLHHLSKTRATPLSRPKGQPDSDPPMYRCPECGKGFLQFDTLSLHMGNMHDGRQPLKCTS